MFSFTVCCKKLHRTDCALELNLGEQTALDCCGSLHFDTDVLLMFLVLIPI